MDSQAGRASSIRLAESSDVSRSRAQTLQRLALLSKETVQLSGQGRGGHWREWLRQGGSRKPNALIQCDKRPPSI